MCKDDRDENLINALTGIVYVDIKDKGMAKALASIIEDVCCKGNGASASTLNEYARIIRDDLIVPMCVYRNIRFDPKGERDRRFIDDKGREVPVQVGSPLYRILRARVMSSHNKIEFGELIGSYNGIGEKKKGV